MQIRQFRGPQLLLRAFDFVAASAPGMRREFYEPAEIMKAPAEASSRIVGAVSLLHSAAASDDGQFNWNAICSTGRRNVSKGNSPNSAR